ncbi:MAG: NnrU family protein [Pseudomonadales bacterium]
MTLLIGGLLLWTLVHLFPSVMPGARASLIGKLGEGPYKGLFALDLLIALLLMVFGWRSATPEFWYAPPLPASPLIFVLVLIAFALMGAANAPTNIKRLLRHPMLTGVIVWGVAHLLANGDSRSVILFGGLSVWAVVAIITISRRDGEWLKPEAVPIQKDIVLLIIGAVLTAVVAYFHEYLSGVPIFGL